MSDPGEPPPIKLVESCDRCGSPLVSVPESPDRRICPMCSKYGPGATADSARQADQAVADATSRGEPEHLMSEKAVAELELDPEITSTFKIIELIESTKRYKALRAYDPNLNCNFLLKILNPGFFDPLVLLPVETAASILVAQTHPHLLTVYDARTTDSGRRYLIMEDPGPVTIESLIEKEGFIELPRAISMYVQACEAIVMLHKLGLLHNAIRPRYLAVKKTESGLETVKLTGYSITSYKEPILETPLKIGRNYTCNDVFYASPEELESRDLSTGTDIYSLACVMFHAMTGKPVYRSREREKVIAQHTGPEKARFRRRYEIPGPVQDVVLHCLEKDPAKRYKSSQDLLLDLQRLEQEKPPLIDSLWKRFLASIFGT